MENYKDFKNILLAGIAILLVVSGGSFVGENLDLDSETVSVMIGMFGAGFVAVLIYLVYKINKKKEIEE